MKSAIIGITILIVITVAIVWLNRQWIHKFSHNSQEKYTVSERNKAYSENMPGMNKYKYFCSDGGPFILITSEIRDKWGGVENMFNPLDPKTDYGKACGIISSAEGDFGIINSRKSEALVVDAPMLAMEQTNKDEVLDIYLLKEWHTNDMDSMIEKCQKDVENKPFENTGKTIEFKTDEVTFMYAGDVYGEFAYNFSNFKIQKGKYELLKFEWENQKLGKITVLKLISETLKQS